MGCTQPAKWFVVVVQQLRIGQHHHKEHQAKEAVLRLVSVCSVRYVNDAQ